MGISELISGILEVLDAQTKFSHWNTIIQLGSLIGAWITIVFLLTERRNRERPYLQISFELIRSSLACLVIRNVGECALEIRTVKFSEEFVKQLPEDTQKRIISLQKSEIKIFPKRYYVFSLDVITGTILKNYNVKHVTIDYEYRKLGKYRKTYKEQSVIDFSQYATMLIYISEIDELKASVDSLISEVRDIKKLIRSTKICDTFETYTSE